MVLDRTGHNLGRTRAALIDQHDQGQVGIAAGMGEILLLLVIEPAFGIHDHPAVEKHIGHLDRLTQQAAGIAAQVKHHALEFLLVLAETLQRVFKIVRGAILKLDQTDIAIARLQEF